MARQARKETIVVVGLGRFGSALAQELFNEGHEVMGIDSDPDLVRMAASYLTFAEVCDATDEFAMGQLGVGQVDHAVVGIGDSLQASILATATLFDLGVRDIWAKALTEQHERILERVGAKHIVFPEGDAGRRVAHRIGVRLEEYVQLDQGFVLVEMTVPDRYAGNTVIEAGLRDDHGVSVVCHKPVGGEFEVTTGHTMLGSDDLILVAGAEDAVNRFARLARPDA